MPRIKPDPKPIAHRRMATTFKRYAGDKVFRAVDPSIYPYKSRITRATRVRRVNVTADAELLIDLQAVCEELAARAFNAMKYAGKTKGQATCMHGAIVLKLTNAEEEVCGEEDLPIHDSNLVLDEAPVTMDTPEVVGG